MITEINIRGARRDRRTDKNGRCLNRRTELEALGERGHIKTAGASEEES